MFLGRLLTWSVRDAENLQQREAAWHIAASILNKRVTGMFGERNVFPTLTDVKIYRILFRPLYPNFGTVRLPILQVLWITGAKQFRLGFG